MLYRGLVLGLFLGGFFTVTIMAACIVAGQADEQDHTFHNGDR